MYNRKILEDAKNCLENFSASRATRKPFHWSFHQIYPQAQSYPQTQPFSSQSTCTCETPRFYPHVTYPSSVPQYRLGETNRVNEVSVITISSDDENEEKTSEDKTVSQIARTQTHLSVEPVSSLGLTIETDSPSGNPETASTDTTKKRKRDLNKEKAQGSARTEKKRQRKCQLFALFMKCRYYQDKTGTILIYHKPKNPQLILSKNGKYMIAKEASHQTYNEINQKNKRIFAYLNRKIYKPYYTAKIRNDCVLLIPNEQLEAMEDKLNIGWNHIVSITGIDQTVKVTQLDGEIETKIIKISDRSKIFDFNPCTFYVDKKQRIFITSDKVDNKYLFNAIQQNTSVAFNDKFTPMLIDGCFVLAPIKYIDDLKTLVQREFRLKPDKNLIELDCEFSQAPSVNSSTSANPTHLVPYPSEQTIQASTEKSQKNPDFDKYNFLIYTDQYILIGRHNSMDIIKDPNKILKEIQENTSDIFRMHFEPCIINDRCILKPKIVGLNIEYLFNLLQGELKLKSTDNCLEVNYQHPQETQTTIIESQRQTPQIDPGFVLASTQSPSQTVEKTKFTHTESSNRSDVQLDIEQDIFGNLADIENLGDSGNLGDLIKYCTTHTGSLFEHSIFHPGSKTTIEPKKNIEDDETNPEKLGHADGFDYALNNIEGQEESLTTHLLARNSIFSHQEGINDETSIEMQMDIEDSKIFEY